MTSPPTSRVVTQHILNSGLEHTRTTHILATQQDFKCSTSYPIRMEQVANHSSLMALALPMNYLKNIPRHMEYWRPQESIATPVVVTISQFSRNKLPQFCATILKAIFWYKFDGIRRIVRLSTYQLKKCSSGTMLPGKRPY